MAGLIKAFHAQRNLNNAFAYDLVPSVSVIAAALKAARRVNDFPTAVRIFEGMLSHPIFTLSDAPEIRGKFCQADVLLRVCICHRFYGKLQVGRLSLGANAFSFIRHQSQSREQAPISGVSRRIKDFTGRARREPERRSLSWSRFLFES